MGNRFLVIWMLVSACSGGVLDAGKPDVALSDGHVPADAADAADHDGRVDSDPAHPADDARRPGPTADARVTANSDAARTGTDAAHAATDGASPPPPSTNDAAFVSQEIPAEIGTGRAFAVRVTMRNTGTTPWARDTGHCLGTTDPMDDPTWGTTRAFIDEGAAIPPGETFTFVAVLTAPAAPGDHALRWRMLQDAVEWFGAPSDAVTVHVVEQGPPAQGPFDLAQVEIVGSPDVRGWPATSEITSIAFRPDNFHIDHTLRGQWPPVVIDPDGTEQEATVWVFFYIGDHWYGTGGERLRPGQADKQLGQPSDIGPGWLYDENRWGPMTNYVAQPGELVGFMVAAGSTRSDANFIVQERTRVVLIPFPRDGEETGFPPFAGGE